MTEPVSVRDVVDGVGAVSVAPGHAGVGVARLLPGAVDVGVAEGEVLVLVLCVILAAHLAVDGGGLDGLSWHSRNGLYRI